MDDLTLLRSVRLKGLADARLIAETIGGAEDEVAQSCGTLVARGLLAATARGLRLTGDGRILLAELSAAERAGLDDSALQEAYGAFCRVNDRLKAAISAWQTRQSHADDPAPARDAAARERAIIDRLAEIHAATAPVLAVFERLVPRLARYRTRLDAAIGRIGAGDHAFIARPIIDSYHTVWFELHEDLLALTGRSRADEAAAGRAG
jgi:pyruvate,orthophosphate dikinase